MLYLSAIDARVPRAIRIALISSMENRRLLANSPSRRGARPFANISSWLSWHVPRNRCSGFTQHGLSHLCKTQRPNGISPRCNAQDSLCAPLSRPLRRALPYPFRSTAPSHNQHPLMGSGIYRLLNLLTPSGVHIVLIIVQPLHGLMYGPVERSKRSRPSHPTRKLRPLPCHLQAFRLLPRGQQAAAPVPARPCASSPPEQQQTQSCP